MSKTILVLQNDLLISQFEVTWARKRPLRHSKEVTLKKLAFEQKIDQPSFQGSPIRDARQSDEDVPNPNNKTKKAPPLNQSALHHCNVSSLMDGSVHPRILRWWVSNTRTFHLHRFKLLFLIFRKKHFQWQTAEFHVLLNS